MAMTLRCSYDTKWASANGSSTMAKMRAMPLVRPGAGLAAICDSMRMSWEGRVRVEAYRIRPYFAGRGRFWLDSCFLFAKLGRFGLTCMFAVPLN
jgi:hypothetical protein